MFPYNLPFPKVSFSFPSLPLPKNVAHLSGGKFNFLSSSSTGSLVFCLCVANLGELKHQGLLKPVFSSVLSFDLWEYLAFMYFHTCSLTYVGNFTMYLKLCFCILPSISRYSIWKVYSEHSLPYCYKQNSEI